MGLPGSWGRVGTGVTVTVGGGVEAGNGAMAATPAALVSGGLTEVELGATTSGAAVYAVEAPYERTGVVTAVDGIVDLATDTEGPVLTCPGGTASLR